MPRVASFKVFGFGKHSTPIRCVMSAKRYRMTGQRLLKILLSSIMIQIIYIWLPTTGDCLTIIWRNATATFLS